MKRTTVYFEPSLELLLKAEALRQKRPMAEVVREAVYHYVTREPRGAPPGAGAFSSGHADTADRAETILETTGFGAPPGPAPGSERPGDTAPRRRARSLARATPRSRPTDSRRGRDRRRRR